jgi:hypothetical protein
LSVTAQSWIVRDLLEAVQWCLSCENSFVEIVQEMRYKNWMCLDRGEYVMEVLTILN